MIHTCHRLTISDTHLSSYSRLLVIQSFGIEVDEGMNEACIGMAETISSQTSLVRVLVIPTDEELSIAQQTVEVLDQMAVD